MCARIIVCIVYQGEDASPAGVDGLSAISFALVEPCDLAAFPPHFSEASASFKENMTSGAPCALTSPPKHGDGGSPAMCPTMSSVGSEPPTLAYSDEKQAVNVSSGAVVLASALEPAAVGSPHHSDIRAAFGEPISPLSPYHECDYLRISASPFPVVIR